MLFKDLIPGQPLVYPSKVTFHLAKRMVLMIQNMKGTDNLILGYKIGPPIQLIHKPHIFNRFRVVCL